MAVYALADEDPSAYDILVLPEEKGGESLPLKLVSFYQKNISPHNGAKCLFYPTCSNFYKSALSRHGLLLGTVMFADRFFYREGIVSMKHYHYMPIQERYFDPVYHNYIFKRDLYYK
jgi:putative component of membrane protein insertase Oxa1/YidC/SpoIIIJ protein YidD